MRRKPMLIFKLKESLKTLAFLMIFPVLLGTSLQANAQESVTITGTITEAVSGDPLPGVSILIKGTTVGTISDVDGNYSIDAGTGDVLVFSFIGYLNEEQTVGTSTLINVALAQDIIGLDEVVVTGYGVQKKSDVTGSIAKVSSDKVTEVPIAGVDQALQGRAAGVNVITGSGLPGEAAKIQIRGISSINGAEPLIIIDGMPAADDALSRLNPNDIESVEVLKDASSAAIYGTKGGNGVVIVTTKKGESGKMVTNFNFYTGFESPVGKIDMMNTEQWFSTFHETNPNDTAITTMPDTFPNYDWQDYVFENSMTQNYDISFAGGNEKSTFLVSSSYNKQDGIIRNSDFQRFTMRVNTTHQLTDRLTFDQKLSYVNTENLGFETGVWHQYYDGPIRPSIQMVPFVPDYLPGFDQNSKDGWANATDYGVPAGSDNPLARLDMIDRRRTFNQFEANLGIKLDIIKGLSFSSRFDGKIDFADSKEFQDEYWNTTTDRRLPDEIKLIQDHRRNNLWITQQLLNYNFTVAEAFNISLLAGMEASSWWSWDIEGERNNVPSIEELRYFSLSSDIESSNQIIDGGGDQGRALSYFGRVNADYKSKYLLTFNMRRDGRSSMGPDKRFGVFPSVSVGWKFSEEAFMQNQNIISFGKVRYGYGITGAYPRSGFPYLSLIRTPMHFAYPFDGASSRIGAAPVKLENPEIHWEEVTMQNIGVDLAMFQNKMTLTAEWFKKINDGMIMEKDVNYEAGTYQMAERPEGESTKPEVNIGSVQNTGFEFSLGYRMREGDLKGSFDLNLTAIQNKVLDLASDSITDPAASVHNISNITMTRIGDPISQFWGWEIDGMYSLDDCEVDENGDYIRDTRGRFLILYHLNSDGDTVWAPQNAQPGDAKFKDVDGDGQVLSTDDKVFLGSPHPKLIFGFSVNLEYKGFDFSAFINGTLGNKIFNGTKQYTYYYQGYPNHHADFANRYIVEDITKIDPVTGIETVVIPENRNTDIMRNHPSNYAKPTSFYIEDGSYLRLRNVSLGYTIPKSITERAKIEKLRVYVGARNLLTITKYGGINPEVGTRGIMDMGIDVGVYPVTRMYLFGANVTF